MLSRADAKRKAKSKVERESDPEPAHDLPDDEELIVPLKFTAGEAEEFDVWNYCCESKYFALIPSNLRS